MRRRRSSLKREKAVMLVSSCMVLTALTATGLYVRNAQDKEQEEKIVDFTALEEQAGKAELTEEELAQMGELDYDPSFYEDGLADQSDLNMLGSRAGEQAAGTGGADGQALADAGAGNSQASTDAGDGRGRTESDAGNGAGQELSDAGDGDGQAQAAAGDGGSQEQADAGDGQTLADAEDADQEALAANASDAIARTEEDGLADAKEAMDPAPVLDFTEGDALTWPIVGNVLVNYSMDKTVYFATLQQYKYSPALVIEATEGEGIAAAADGQVTSVYDDPETGTTVVMNLGDGYELTYGQLTDLTVAEGDVVTTGEIIGKVAAPTMYYSVEGCNVYFKLTKDGQPVNPMNRLS